MGGGIMFGGRCLPFGCAFLGWARDRQGRRQARDDKPCPPARQEIATACVAGLAMTLCGEPAVGMREKPRVERGAR